MGSGLRGHGGWSSSFVVLRFVSYGIYVTCLWPPRRRPNPHGVDFQSVSLDVCPLPTDSVRQLRK